MLGYLGLGRALYCLQHDYSTCAGSQGRAKAFREVCDWPGWQPLGSPERALEIDWTLMGGARGSLKNARTAPAQVDEHP